MFEEWKPISNYEGYYSVSSLGNVRRNCNRIGLPRIRILKKIPLKTGYLRVYLCLHGIVKTYYVHRLVAREFIGKQPKNKEVNHKDCNKKNNDYLPCDSENKLDERNRIIHR